MKRVITAEDAQEAIARGECLKQLTAGAVVTPSAQDIIQDAKSAASGGANTGLGSAAGGGNEFERRLYSPEVRKLKEDICDVGRRLWTREYVDGNGGNISIKLADNIVLCTPTMVSKGFMQPDDMCLVDMEGNQLAGKKKRTSEILMHLSIMKAQPKAKSCVHCHPPYATAFAVSGVKPPNNMLPEYEVFVGEAPIAEYHTPGTPAMGHKVAELADKHNTILMANHGVVSWSDHVEDAYFKMEIIEAYCRTILVTTQLGKTPRRFTGPQMKELLDIKERIGIVDPRHGLPEASLASDDRDWRPGVSCIATSCDSQSEQGAAAYNPDAEEVVRIVTDKILENL